MLEINGNYDKTWEKFWIHNNYDESASKMKLLEFVKSCEGFDLNTPALQYFNNKISNKTLQDNIKKAGIAFKHLGIKKDEVVFIFGLNTPEIVTSLYALNNIGAVSEWFNSKGLSVELMRKYLIENNVKHLIITDVIYGLAKEAIKGTNVERVIVNSLRDSFDILTDIGYMASLLGVDKVVNNPLSKAILSKEKESLLKNKLKELEVYHKDSLVKAKLAFRVDKSVSDKFITWGDFINDYYRDEKENNVKFEEDKTSMIVHTGGTTGQVKQIEMTDFNINSAVYNTTISIVNREYNDTFCQLVPPIVALSLYGIHLSRYYNMKTCLIPSYNQAEFCDIILKTKANHYFTVPAFLITLIDNKKLDKKDLSFIKNMFHGGEGITPEQDEKIDKLLKDHGSLCKTAHVFGQNEEFGCCTINLVNDNKKYGSCGYPLPNNELVIINPETNEILKHGINENGEYNVGKVYVSGNTVMKGYTGHDKELNDKVFIKINGKKFLDTGDQGYIDEDGLFFFATRDARIIRTQEGKVFVNVIENIINKFDEVKLCTVVAVPNEISSKKPSCHIVLNEKYDDYSKEDRHLIFENLVHKIEEASKELYEYYHIPTFKLHDKDFDRTPFGKVDFKKLEKENEEEYKKNNKVMQKIRF